jgi:hypothetical protein
VEVVVVVLKLAAEQVAAEQAVLVAVVTWALQLVKL